MMKKLFDFEPGKILHVFSKSETAGLRKKYMKIFCKNKQGVNTKAYLWHIFCSQRYFCLTRQKAEDEYLKQLALEYIILPNECEFAVLINEKPLDCFLSDYYVFPKNMSWTMAITHEDGFLDGPYFAKHPDYIKLNKINLARYKTKIDKQKQIEIARLKGWM